MVSEYGMSALGPIYFGDPRSEPISQNLLDRVEEAVNEIINTQLTRACEMVTAQQDAIARLVELLMEHDTVEADDIQRCFAAAPPVAVQTPAAQMPQQIQA
jgi:ATP-dependent Zn protease